ncbi:MAG: Fic family protein [Ignavibacteriales bacterium]|nr:Fic family protein [Ignavibacteriales bacterium]
MNNLPEIIYSSSDKKISGEISKLVKNKKLKKIAPRIYTSNFFDSESSIIRRNLLFILGKLYPGSILSFRSAFEFKPAEDGSIYLTYKYSKLIYLLDLKIKLIKGKGPVEGDNKVFGELYVSQKARAFLENLTRDKTSGSSKRNLSTEEIERELEKIIVTQGEKEINELRDNARKISVMLNFHEEFRKLNKIISALLKSHPSDILKSPVAIARAFGKPYDSKRVELFGNLFEFLNTTKFSAYPETNITEKSFKNFAFFESYFSNYIEGTVLEIEDAKKVITTGIPLPSQENDSHDVLGTYLIVSDRTGMSKTPDSFEEFIELLKHRHKILLSSREGKSPGEFKNVNNRAGSTEFVDFTLVAGTLEKSFEYYKLLTVPFSKAAYMLFIISEIHPFIDGNGRIARIIMNSELVKSKQSKILIPNVYREDYLLSLKQVTKKSDFQLFIKMLDRARIFSSGIIGDDINTMQSYLIKCNAFLEPDEGSLKL